MTLVASIVLIVGLSAFLALWGYSAFAAFQRRKLHSYKEWADRFFNLSARLIDRGDLPSEWTETIASLNEWIDDPRMADGLAKSFEPKTKQQLDQAAKSGSSLTPEEIAYLERHPSVGRDYVSATRAAFLALTFLAPLTTGERTRSLMAEQWERRRGKLVSEDIEVLRKVSHLRLVHSAA